METKFCKDCKYCKRDWDEVIFFRGYQYAECRHPNFKNVSPVDGKPTHSQKFCSIERKDWVGIDVCGPEGKYFEEKRKWLSI